MLEIQIIVSLYRFIDLQQKDKIKFMDSDKEFEQDKVNTRSF